MNKDKRYAEVVGEIIEWSNKRHPFNSLDREERRKNQERIINCFLKDANLNLDYEIDKNNKVITIQSNAKRLCIYITHTDDGGSSTKNDLNNVKKKISYDFADKQFLSLLRMNGSSFLNIAVYFPFTENKTIDYENYFYIISNNEKIKKSKSYQKINDTENINNSSDWVPLQKFIELIKCDIEIEPFSSSKGRNSQIISGWIIKNKYLYKFLHEYLNSYFNIYYNEELPEDDWKYNSLLNSKIEKQIVNTEKYKRNLSIVNKVLERSNYKCEVNNNHETFNRKTNGKPFLEVHHLIPISKQNCFSISIDCVENLVSLCPSCHREIHYGSDNLNLVKILFDKRNKELNEYGIKITFNDLKKFY